MIVESNLIRYEQISKAFDDIKESYRSQLGQKDIDYIKGIRKKSRIFEFIGRSFIWFGFDPFSFSFGILFLFLHHRYVNFNFNLLLGGDIIWRCQRFLNQEDIIEIKKLGLFIKNKPLIEQKNI